MNRYRLPIAAFAVVAGAAFLGGCVAVPGPGYDGTVYSGAAYSYPSYPQPYYTEPGPVVVGPPAVYINGGTRYYDDRGYYRGRPGYYNNNRRGYDPRPGGRADHDRGRDQGRGAGRGAGPRQSGELRLPPQVQVPLDTIKRGAPPGQRGDGQ